MDEFAHLGHELQKVPEDGVVNHLAGMPADRRRNRVSAHITIAPVQQRRHLRSSQTAYAGNEDGLVISVSTLERTHTPAATTHVASFVRCTELTHGQISCARAQKKLDVLSGVDLFENRQATITA